jgi:hypothetical protein
MATLDEARYRVNWQLVFGSLAAGVSLGRLIGSAIGA